MRRINKHDGMLVTSKVLRLVRAVRKGEAPAIPDLSWEHFDPLYSDRLAPLLHGAATQLAVFSACNSGRWAFVEPFLAAGLPALVGAQGQVSILAATVFCARLYTGLAVGLSLDEAVQSARLEVLDAGVSPTQESCEWGAFMVYLPAIEAVLFPRPAEDPAVQESQTAHRNDSQRRAGKRALRQAIGKAFTAEELEIICADVEEDLRHAGRPLDGPVELEDGQKEYRTFKPIDYLDRRGYLDYLEQAARRARPGLRW